MQQVQGEDGELQPGADEECRRAHDDLLRVHELRESVEVLLGSAVRACWRGWMRGVCAVSGSWESRFRKEFAAGRLHGHGDGANQYS